MKIFLCILLLPIFAFGDVKAGSSFTPVDTALIVNTALSLQKDSQALFNYAHSIDTLVKNGYTYKVNYTPSTAIEGTMTAQQQQDTVDYYQALKLQLQTDLGKLP